MGLTDHPDSLIGAASTWVSKVHTLWKFSIIHRYLGKKNESRMTEVEVTAESPRLEVDEVDSDELVPVAGE
jgi:hypothetical protein